MPDCCIDLVVTSPPYDNMRSYEGKAFTEFNAIVKQLHRVVKPGGIVAWIVGDQTKDGDESGTSFRQALHFKDCGFNLFDTMIYEKSPKGAAGNNKAYWQCFEYMFIFSKGSPKTINLICDRRNKEIRSGDNGTRRLPDGRLLKGWRGGYNEYGRRTNIWKYLTGKGHSATDKTAYLHPAIFPEKLAEDHILSWSNEGDIVYDPFCGSGTTPLMAQVNNRLYIGSEISEAYCAVAERRIERGNMPVMRSNYRQAPHRFL